MFAKSKKKEWEFLMRDIKGLLESVSVDNRGAFERFYNLYYDQVFRFAYYCLGEKEACREVVTDVFFLGLAIPETIKGY